MFLSIIPFYYSSCNVKQFLVLVTFWKRRRSTPDWHGTLLRRSQNFSAGSDIRELAAQTVLSVRDDG